MSSQTLKAIATGQPAEKAPSPYERLKHQLETSKAEFLPLFGGSASNVNKFVRVVLNAVMANPALLDADRRSLIASCMKAAQDGLLPDGREAVLNIYSTKVKGPQGDRWIDAVQYLPMVGGLIKNLYASGEITSLDAAAVYEHDRFLFRRGDDPKLEHEPTLDDDPGRIVAAYVVVKMKNGDIKREVMPRRDIEAVRAAGKNSTGASSPWVKWYDQQAIKSVIKRAYKQLPKSEKFEQADAADNQALGFAATPQSVADIAVRNAIAYSEPDTLDFGPGADTREAVPVQRQAEARPAAENQQRQQQQRPAQQQQVPDEQGHGPDDWRPTPEEEAAIRARELAEAGGQPADTQQTGTPPATQQPTAERVSRRRPAPE